MHTSLSQAFKNRLSLDHDVGFESLRFEVVNPSITTLTTWLVLLSGHYAKCVRPGLVKVC